MAPGLLEINPPRELKFAFEVKKKSYCSVQLVNKTHEYVAFKHANAAFDASQIKTTSPKRYSVQPNTGVILPRSKCEFTVTMQAQRAAPPDMQLKDKFLVQSTVVPFGSADEDIVPSFFSKETGRYIEENKMRVVLVSPPDSPALQPPSGDSRQEPANEGPLLKETTDPKESPAFKEFPAFKQNSALKEAPDLKKTPDSGAENLSVSSLDVEDLKLRINNLESKLNEANKMIASLQEEKSSVLQERDKLLREIVLLRRKSVTGVETGFPFSFVVFMALIGMAFGYMLNQ